MTLRDIVELASAKISNPFNCKLSSVNCTLPRRYSLSIFGGSKIPKLFHGIV